MYFFEITEIPPILINNIFCVILLHVFLLKNLEHDRSLYSIPALHYSSRKFHFIGEPVLIPVLCLPRAAMATIMELRKPYLLGVVKLRLEHIAYEHFDVLGSRSIDARNVERIVNIFYLQAGCDRVNYPVDAYIDGNTLTRALHSASLEPADLGSAEPRFLPLPSGSPAVCMHGKHRLEAGRSFLEEEDRWWTVHLYCAGMGVDPPQASRRRLTSARHA